MDSLLPDGDCIYMYEMEDAQGNSELSEGVMYYLENGLIGWYET